MKKAIQNKYKSMQKELLELEDNLLNYFKGTHAYACAELSIEFHKFKMVLFQTIFKKVLGGKE